MSANTKVGWAHDTFNGWEGCQHVGPGCDHCYAETRNARFNGGTAIHWGPHAERRLTSAANWNLPLKWDREAAASGLPRRVFCSSLSDVFDKKAPAGARARLGKLIKATPHLTWMLLTKRPGNFITYLLEMFPDGVAPANVWLGMTVVNQAEADRDRLKLKDVKLHWRISRVFVSIEPMLGPIDLTGYEGWLDWAIVGGESGRSARPMHPDWARQVRDFCAAHGIAFFFKQWGEYLPDTQFDVDGFQWAPGRDGKVHWWVPESAEDEEMPVDGFSVRVGKAQAGEQLDGALHHNWPEAA